MAKRSIVISILALFSLALLWGCGELGQVDQGRVIAYDSAKGTVTLIQDKKGEPGNPDYNTLPPHTYNIPSDPNEMGPVPKAGERIKLDLKTKEITIFDPKTQNFKVIPFTLIDQRENIGRDNPLVKGKTFPIIDKEKKTITEYSGRQRVLVTFSVADEYFELPEYYWEAGDEVRIYYKEPGKALRMMNITQTDIFKK
jgi:hypothetical protein